MKRLLLFLPFLAINCSAMEPAALEETEPIEIKREEKNTHKAAYSLTDNDGIHELTAEQHLILMKCQMYKNNISETGTIVDISSSTIESVTHTDILKLIDVIKDPQQISTLGDEEIVTLFELANYLDAPTAEVTKPLAEQCHAVLTKLIEQKNQLSQLGKSLFKESKNYLFYETFAEFFADYTQKEGPIARASDMNFNFSYAHLKSLGFIKKIKSVTDLGKVFNAHGYDHPFFTIHIDLSGHAIEDFSLNNFQCSFSPLHINLSNNQIKALKPEQFIGRQQNVTLILDRNPITSIGINFANPHLFVTNRNPNRNFYSPLNISLRNIWLSADSLGKLPIKQSIVEKLQDRMVIASRSKLTSRIGNILAFAGIFASLKLANYSYNKKLIKNTKLNALCNIAQVFGIMALLAVASTELENLTQRAFNELYSTMRIIINTDYGTHVLRIA